MKKVLLLTTIGVLCLVALTKAQNVFNPNDKNRRWVNNGTNYSNDSTALTANPNPNIAGLQKWVSVKTSGVDSNAWGKDYKAYFLNINGIKLAFRLKFPKSYSNPDSAGKIYPIMLFFHGAGEPGCPTNGGVYNNEKQLVHGGQRFRNAVESNSFDGFLLYPQCVVNDNSCWSDWGLAAYSVSYNAVIAMLDSMSKYVRADIDRVFVDGLSNGGMATWSMAATYPQRVTKAAPSSAASPQTNFSDFVHIPIWFATGGKDTNPNPSYAQSSYDAMKNIGANIRWTLYPELGHFTWDTHWAEPDFLPYMNDMHKANPLVYFQRYDFCPDSAIDTKIGITAGFYAYEWQKDGITIATRVNGVNTIIDNSSLISFTGNEIRVKSFGTYRVRFKRSATADWSLFSPKPAVIYAKIQTVTPPIAVNGLRSKVLPSVDGSNTVPLTLPSGYYGYQWIRTGDNVIVSTSNTFTAPVGQYKAKIVEQFGCGSIFSPLFNVVPANGSPKPDAAKNLSAFSVSVGAIQLDWNENPNAGQNETGYEIYRATTSGGPYQLIKITAPDVTTYTDNAIQGNTQYYYVVRAVSDFGAAANSNEASVVTQVDNTPPSIPGNLTVTCASRTNVSLKWTASTDNLSVSKYDIYVNGVKLYSTTNTYISINELDPRQTYTFSVRAKDAAGNVSQPSTEVVASTIAQGVCYKYFTNPVGLTEIPSYADRVPVAEGIASNIAFTAGGTDNFGYLWEGYIRIPNSGSYRFQICSDDGSKFYFNTPYNPNAAETINNDGLHGTQCVNSSAISLTAGQYYPIAATFFEEGGGQAMTFNWSFNSGSYSAVPNSAFQENPAYTPGGSAPAAPSAVKAVANSYKQTTITWADNSNNETGFEIVRSSTLNGTYNPVGTTTTTTYIDSNQTASTMYFYKVRAVGSYGQSAYTSAETIWHLDNNYSDGMGSTTRTLAGGGGTANPTFSTDRAEGSHSVSLDGTNDYISVNNSTSGGFPSDGVFSQRTISLWVKPAVTTGKRILFDFGGADNGIALRFNGNALEAGIASGSVRNTVSLANFASNANWISGGWNHLAVVYSTTAMRIYINGVQVATNGAAFTFSSIAANSSSASRIGYPDAANAFNDAQNTYAFYQGLIDGVQVQVNESATASQVLDMMNFNYGQSMDTTQAAPAVPASPTVLTAQVVGKDGINLQWNDNSNNETGFEIFRSVGNQSNYRLVKTIPGGAGTTKNYSDTALFANTTYYYQVRATGIGGNSGYTNVANAKTLNTPPTISHILDFTMKYETSFTQPINAVDEDGDPLTFQFDNLPWFAQVQNVNNGNINLVMTPTIGDQGAYTITVYVSDGNEGYDTTYYTMVVNDNTIPTMANLLDQTVQEGKVLTVPVSANDLEGNSYMVWSFDNMPSFASFVDSGNGKGAIILKPGYSASGVYNMTAYVDDGNGAWVSKTFKITVSDFDPNESIRVDFKYFTGSSPTWNDVDLFNLPAPFNKGSLVTVKGAVTSVGVQALSTNYNGSTGGTQTGNNSGLYPDAVLRDYLEWGLYNFNSTDTFRLRVYGLDTARRYNFVFFSGSLNNCCGINASSTTRFLIGNDVAQVNYYLNTTMSDTIYQVKPNASGQVTITMVGDPNTLAGGLLNAMVIDAAYDDGTTPAKPLNLTADFIENGGVQLNWVDRAYNEFGYQVFRATNQAGPYSLINGGLQNKDSISYIDLTAKQYTTYYYYVVGYNNHGNGITSDTVSITTQNNRPVITSLSNFKVKTDASVNEDFTVEDVPTDVLTVYIENQPSFVTLTDLGSGNYRISASPTIDNLGQQFLRLVAKDDKGGVSTQDFIITVTDKNVRSIFVNFGDYAKVAPAPWNNFLHYGGQGQVINGLVDEDNNPTSVSMAMTDGWSSRFLTGIKTGNNSGVVPDTVLSGGIYYSGTNARAITITGLSGGTKRYNVVVIGSQNEGLEAVMRVSTNVGSQSDTLNAKYNTNMTANLNGLTASGGAITINFNKLSTGNTNMYLNAIIIEEYESSITLMNPVNLYVEPKDRTTTVLSWSDRSNNENAADGFQLQRATDSLFTQNVTNIAIAGNNSVYTNTGLTPNTKYFYRIRAKNGASTFSDWSNTEKTITPLSMIFVNFNQNVQSAGSPWNNLESFPSPGVTYTNLKNQSNVNTGYTLTITKTFNGENNAGMSTGNNSGFGGLVPDLVSQSGYWMDNLQQSQVKLSGLNQGKRYRIGYISSSNWIGGNLTATFTVNGRTVYINSWQNTSKIVYIGNLQADDNGELYLNISTTGEAANAYSSGLIIEAYDDVNGGAVLNSINPNGLVNNVATEGPANPVAVINPDGKKVDITTYPNPFTDIINLDFSNDAASNNIGVDIYDLSGSLIMKRNFGQMPLGPNTLRISTTEGKLSTGVYLVTLTVNGKPAAAAKLVKTKK